MDHVQNELLASQQGVVLKLACANGELRHGWLAGLLTSYWLTPVSTCFQFWAKSNQKTMHWTCHYKYQLVFQTGLSSHCKNDQERMFSTVQPCSIIQSWFCKQWETVTTQPLRTSSSFFSCDMNWSTGPCRIASWSKSKLSSIHSRKLVTCFSMRIQRLLGFLYLFSLLGAGLCLVLATGLLHAILGVLLGTSSRSRLLTTQTSPLETVLWLKLLQLLNVLIDQTKAAAASTSESCLEAEELDALNIMNLVHAAQLLSQVLLGDIGHARMDHVQKRTACVPARGCSETCVCERWTQTWLVGGTFDELLADPCFYLFPVLSQIKPKDHALNMPLQVPTCFSNRVIITLQERSRTYVQHCSAMFNHSIVMVQTDWRIYQYICPWISPFIAFFLKSHGWHPTAVSKIQAPVTGFTSASQLH